MKREKVLCCPWCGEDSKILIRTDNYGRSWGSVKSIVGIGCVNINCAVKPIMSADNNNINDKITEWNKRIIL